MNIVILLAYIRLFFTLGLAIVTYNRRDHLGTVLSLTWAATIAVTVLAGYPQYAPLFATADLLLVALYINKRR